jgi:hypothetical protein
LNEPATIRTKKKAKEKTKEKKKEEEKIKKNKTNRALNAFSLCQLKLLHMYTLFCF